MLPQLLLVISLVSFSHGFLPKPRLDGRIVGGYPVEVEDVPYQVSLQNWGSHFCGGSLLSREWVLTAGHCAASGSSVSVRVGSTYHNKGGVVLSSEKVVRHPKYNSASIDYDFSLVKLAQPVPENVTYGVAKLVEQDEDVEDGEMLRVSGWGNTQNSQESSLHLRAVDVPKVNQEKCSQAYASYGGVTPRMLCAGFVNGGKDSCQGDSGGPLTANGHQVGVVSWGYGCAMPKYPGVYARVASVRNWVEEVSGL